MQVEEIVDAVPRVAQNVLAREVVELARIDHERDEIAFAVFSELVNEPDRFQERHVHVGGAVEDEQRALRADRCAKCGDAFA